MGIKGQRPILTIANAHGKLAVQVMLRSGVQTGRSVIPKSVRPTRLAENFAMFDFEPPDRRAAIHALNTSERGGPVPSHSTPCQSRGGAALKRRGDQVVLFRASQVRIARLVSSGCSS